MSRVAKGIRTALVAAAVAGFSVSVAAPPAAAAKECKSSVSGSSKGKFKIKKAKNLARASWRGAARAAHGGKYDKWYKAKDKSVNCAKKGLKWSCTMSARPCK